MWGMKHVTLREGEVGLVYENGRFVHQVAPGRITLTTLPWRKQEIVRVDTRRKQLNLPGQEMLTSDGFSARLTVAAEYRVVDAPRALHSVENYQAALYTALQLILRDEVQARTLDALLAERNALGAVLLRRGEPEAESLGLALTQTGVRDIVLSAEIKKMLSQEVEAQRAGRAALAAAREETAAMRAKANTARLMQESPALLRLREWESLEKVGDGKGNTVVVALPPEALAVLQAAKGL